MPCLTSWTSASWLRPSIVADHEVNESRRTVSAVTFATSHPCRCISSWAEQPPAGFGYLKNERDESSKRGRAGQRSGRCLGPRPVIQNPLRMLASERTGSRQSECNIGIAHLSAQFAPTRRADNYILPPVYLVSRRRCVPAKREFVFPKL
jgi:hypothetical protein